MKQIEIPFGPTKVTIALDDAVDVLSMPTTAPVADAPAAVAAALTSSIGTPGLSALARAAVARKSDAQAVILVSDHTRPVPYHGDGGILWPIIARLLDAGFTPDRILVLVATGTHVPLTAVQLRAILDERVFTHGIRVMNHDSRDPAALVNLGKTSRGGDVLISRHYLAADLKILTGLVESHFIAGVSGGRKAVCPGVIGEETTYVFHSAQMLAAPGCRDLNLQDNPSHEESLEVAKMAGADYIVNVTLDKDFKITGVFAGDLEQAHLAAYRKLIEYVQIPVRREYDLILTHGGFVAINHYQAVKACLAALPALKPGSHLVLACANTDTDPIGSLKYRAVLHLLTLIGPEAFKRLIFSADWKFIPEQWEVQAWAKIFETVPPANFVYYSPWMPQKDYPVFPGVDGNALLPADQRYRADVAPVQTFFDAATTRATEALASRGIHKPAIAFLSDGPYGILDSAK